MIRDSQDPKTRASQQKMFSVLPSRPVPTGSGWRGESDHMEDRAAGLLPLVAEVRILQASEQRERHLLF